MLSLTAEEKEVARLDRQMGEEKSDRQITPSFGAQSGGISASSKAPAPMPPHLSRDEVLSPHLDSFMGADQYPPSEKESFQMI